MRDAKTTTGEKPAKDEKQSFAPPVRGSGASRDYLALINRVLTCLCLVMLAAGVYRYLKLSAQKDDTGRAQARESEQVSAALDKLFADPKVFDYYEKQFQERNLFEPLDFARPQTAQHQEPVLPAQPVQEFVTPPTVQTAEPMPPPPEPQPDYDAQLKSRYKLVGIVLDRNSKAVMEDAQNNTTLFLSVGDRLGETLVTTIAEDRVVLTINNTDVEFVRNDDQTMDP